MTSCVTILTSPNAVATSPKAGVTSSEAVATSCDFSYWGGEPNSKYSILILHIEKAYYYFKFIVLLPQVHKNIDPIGWAILVCQLKIDHAAQALAAVHIEI